MTCAQIGVRHGRCVKAFKDLMGEGLREFTENRLCAGYTPVKVLGCDVARLMKGLLLGSILSPA